MPTRSVLKLKLNRMNPCALGYGRRLGIWLQGCTLACAGCCSRDTWGAGSRHDVEWPFFSAALDFALTGRPLDGVTISGGEPFQQREALLALVREIRAIQSRLSADWDILLYTGYAFDGVAAEADVFAEIDLLVAGPYDATLPKATLRGSSNQTLHHLTNRAADRYSESWLSGPGQAAHMDVALAGNDLLLTGLPASGDLMRFERALSAHAVRFRTQSWRDARTQTGDPRNAE